MSLHVCFYFRQVSVNGLDKAGSTPLHWAAHGGHTECLRTLLAVPNCQVNSQVRSHIAVTFPPTSWFAGHLSSNTPSNHFIYRSTVESPPATFISTAQHFKSTSSNLHAICKMTMATDLYPYHKAIAHAKNIIFKPCMGYSLLLCCNNSMLHSFAVFVTCCSTLSYVLIMFLTEQIGGHTPPFGSLERSRQ